MPSATARYFQRDLATNSRGTETLKPSLLC